MEASNFIWALERRIGLYFWRIWLNILLMGRDYNDRSYGTKKYRRGGNRDRDFGRKEYYNDDVDRR